jgi:hypothetical protein
MIGGALLLPPAPRPRPRPGAAASPENPSPSGSGPTPGPSSRPVPRPDGPPPRHGRQCGRLHHGLELPPDLHRLPRPAPRAELYVGVALPRGGRPPPPPALPANARVTPHRRGGRTPAGFPAEVQIMRPDPPTTSTGASSSAAHRTPGTTLHDGAWGVLVNEQLARRRGPSPCGDPLAVIRRADTPGPRHLRRLRQPRGPRRS